MACFADINISQGSVATYARCGGIFNMHLTANLPRMKKIINRLKFYRIMVMSLWPLFCPPCIQTVKDVTLSSGRVPWLWPLLSPARRHALSRAELGAEWVDGRLRGFLIHTEIVIGAETCRSLPRQKWALSVINWTVVGKLDWQYLRRSTASLLH